MTTLKKLAIKLFIAWLICVVLFVLITIYIIGVRGELYNETNNLLTLSGIGLLALGVLTFIASVFFLTWNKIVKPETNNFWAKGLISFMLLPIAPFYFILSSIKNLISKKQAKQSSTRYLLLGMFILTPIWFLGYFLSYKAIETVAGLGYDFVQVRDSESMEPTIPAGTGFKRYNYQNIWYQLNHPNKYQFKRGDIVSFSTEKSRELIAAHGLEPYYFFKRVVALPGEKVTIAGGLVFIDGEPLEEPYTLEKNNTFTGDLRDEEGNLMWESFIQECETLVVPDNSLFVLGDNRKHSDDSRWIGFVPFDDVIGYLPFDEQKEEYCYGNNCFKHDEKWRELEGFDEEKIQLILDECKKLELDSLIE